MKRSILIAVGLVLFGVGIVGAGTWTTIPDYPGAGNTRALGISGTDIVGFGVDTIQYGFLYNITTKRMTNLPISGYGINGSNLVGGSNQLYNMTTQSLTTLNMPGAQFTGILGLNGNNLVGYCVDGSGTHGFLYNGTNWTTLNAGGYATYINGVDGSNLVGWYYQSQNGNGIQHGFLYNGTSFMTLDYPGASQTGICGIEGSNLVGYYTDGYGDWHGLLYNMTTQNWTALDYPGASHTCISGISGNNLVGSYYNGHPMGGQNFNWHGVIYALTEPASLLLHDPNGGESIGAGAIYTIDWSNTGSISNVLIEYSTNNGGAWNDVNTVPNTDSYNWLVPAVNSNQCLVRISDAALPTIYDISNNVFEITIPKTITVSSPNGGESLISGTEQLIQWSSTGAISGVLIEYSVNNGQNWFPVEPANIGNSGSYNWLVTNYNSDQCLIRVSAVDTDINDVSDDVFTISPENPSGYPTLYEILGGSAPAIEESGRDFVARSLPDVNVVAFILLEAAGYANENVFGIYSAYDPQQKLQLFSGSDSPADMTTVKFNATAGTAENLQTGQTANIEKFFGFYLTTPQNGGITYYTDSTRNPDSSEHGLIFNTSGFAGVIENDPDTVIAFEDLLGLGDRDYNDMVVGITNAIPMAGSKPYCIKVIPGDINGDCKVDFADFAIFCQSWLECNLDPQEACGQ